jgi:hypothetical protein
MYVTLEGSDEKFVDGLIRITESRPEDVSDPRSRSVGRIRGNGSN